MLLTLLMISLVFGQDSRTFANGSDVDVFVNYDTCEDSGFPAADRDAFYSMVIDSYTRWMHVAGVDVNLKARGYTTRTNANTNEIVVQCNTFHNDSWHPDFNNNGIVDGAEPSFTCATGAAGCNCWDCNRVASTFGSTGGRIIVVHRQSGQTYTDWDFTNFRDSTGTRIDLHGVMMHEIGHALGLDHGNGDDLMNANVQTGSPLGPRPDDIDDLRAQYALRTDLRFQVHRSTNSGSSWTSTSTNLGGLGVSTTNPASTARDFGDDQTLLAYTDTNKKPSWIVGDRDGNNFDTATWTVYGGLHSLYGMGAHGYDDEYMMTWVDGDSADNAVKVVYSSNDASSFVWRNPPTGSRSRGTPAVLKVAADTWVLAYADAPEFSTNLNWGATGADELGRILVRVSTNDGATWGPETELNTFYRARTGVSLASNGTGEIRVGFAWDGTSTSTKNRMRTLVGRIVGSSMVYDRVITDYDFNTFTRTIPTMGSTSVRFVRGWRESNFDTSINSEYSAFGSTTWDDWQRIVTTSLVNPAFSADRRSTWSYMFSLQ
ncbi:MAG: matrixin family metalloprotease [Myxococcota bacterium]